MLKKIISGGQTGADRAALDVAIKFNIDHGGWIPKGRKTEDGPLPEMYQLMEMESDDYRDRTRQNIVDSHGTVIISRGELTGGSKLTQSYAKVAGKPNCFLNLSYTEEFEASMFLQSFISENKIGVLNVAGPRLSGQPWIYNDVKTILEVMIYLFYSDSGKSEKILPYVPETTTEERFPETLKEACSLLNDLLPLRTKSFIAKFNSSNIGELYFEFMDYIKHVVGFNTANPELFKSCAKTIAGSGNCTVEDSVMQILKYFKKYIENEYLLRVVK